MKVRTNLFAKNQRVISAAYRKGWSEIFCKKPEDCNCCDCRNKKLLNRGNENGRTKK